MTYTHTALAEEMSPRGVSWSGFQNLRPVEFQINKILVSSLAHTWLTAPIDGLETLKLPSMPPSIAEPSRTENASLRRVIIDDVEAISRAFSCGRQGRTQSNRQFVYV